ncbi:PKHD-type hydroxylase [Spatholobus suberectus]|nr:PKHD-type hydroxylase [Spatholobus suberectus]
MSQNQNGSLERGAPQQPRPSNEHVPARVINWSSIQNGSRRLCISPKRDHKPENYEDFQLEFNPHVFSSLEHYLPPHMLNRSRDVKVQYMRNILLHYLPESERIRTQEGGESAPISFGHPTGVTEEGNAIGPLNLHMQIMLV